MAKISTYPFPSPPTVDDYVIGTDTNDSLATKNFKISDILALGEDYVPYTGANANVDLGVYSLYTYGIVLQGGTIVDGNDSEGTLGQVLTSQGPGNMPLWQDTSMVPKKYGSFYNNANQLPLAALPSSYPVIMGGTDISSGVSVVSDGTDLTRITVSKTAVYNISFSANVVNGSGSKHVCYFFLRKNGNAPFHDVPNTLRYSDVAGNSAHTMSLNYFISLNAGDYVYIMLMVSNTTLTLNYNAGTASYPETPSVIVTVNEI